MKKNLALALLMLCSFFINVHAQQNQENSIAMPVASAPPLTKDNNYSFLHISDAEVFLETVNEQPISRLSFNCDCNKIINTCC